MATTSAATHAAAHVLRRAFSVLLLALMLVVVAYPVPADAASATVEAERDFAALVNVERAKKGLGALAVRADIVKVARGHSVTMAAKQRLHHNPDFSKEITGWQRVSENVGVGPSVISIHNALMNSEGHRRNILDDRVTELGIGVTIAHGRVWVTQNFRRPQSGVTVSPPSTTTFGDVSSTSTHAKSILTVASKGIADDCSRARFCPNDSVSRGEFASVLVRALNLPATSARTFSDVSGEYAADIEALAAAGLTSGCDVGRFCPDRSLTREQMATFFARALRLPPRASPFTDMSSTHDGSVGALAAEGIIKGCSTTTFCPGRQVTKAQMASMVARNLG